MASVEDLLCRLRNFGDQLVGGRVEHIHPPEGEAWLYDHLWVPLALSAIEDQKDNARS